MLYKKYFNMSIICFGDAKYHVGMSAGIVGQIPLTCTDFIGGGTTMCHWTA